ncbi:transporter [bacterium]|jgi:hypothetical protein|nr:transporter [bacterium]
MKNKLFCLMTGILLLSAFSPAMAVSRPDAHAPISVMGEHTHNKGEWMLSTRYMRMNMAGLNSAATGYMMAPQSMSMDMLMLGAMIAPTDDFTWMIMLPWSRKNMTMINQMSSATMSEMSQGFGDVSLSALYTIWKTPTHKLHLTAGASLPIGRINSSTGGSVQTYPMQIGSGSTSLLPGLTYVQTHADLSLGAQTSATIRTNDNPRDYRLGDQYKATTWIAKPLGNSLSISARVDHTVWGSIKGSDATISSTKSPAGNPINSGGTRTEIGLGINFIQPEGPYSGHRFALELITPIAQTLNGSQLETTSIITLGWQYGI